MIFKKNLKVVKIELNIQEAKQIVFFHAHLSDDRVWSMKFEITNQRIFFDRGMLEAACLNIMAKGIKKLGEEMG